MWGECLREAADLRYRVGTGKLSVPVQDGPTDEMHGERPHWCRQGGLTDMVEDCDVGQRGPWATEGEEHVYRDKRRLE